MNMGSDGQITPLTRLAAGACAGIIAMSATYPLDMVRGRLTVQEGTGMYNGMWHATKTIMREVRRVLCLRALQSVHSTAV